MSAPRSLDIIPFDPARRYTPTARGSFSVVSGAGSPFPEEGGVRPDLTTIRIEFSGIMAERSWVGMPEGLDSQSGLRSIRRH